jgi:hypothetical protein
MVADLGSLLPAIERRVLMVVSTSRIQGSYNKG